jgi:hypothetical protein
MHGLTPIAGCARMHGLTPIEGRPVTRRKTFQPNVRIRAISHSETGTIHFGLSSADDADRLAHHCRLVRFSLAAQSAKHPAFTADR